MVVSFTEMKKPVSRRKLSQVDIRHGELQIKNMLKDRPVMAKHITKNDIIWKWVVRKFAGEDLEDTIDWNNAAPYYGAQADHIYPCSSERGFVRIAKKLSFEFSWARAIFELHNMAFCCGFKKLIYRAYKGKKKKKEFIKGLATCPDEWYVGTPRFFREWIKHYGRNSEYPWRIYSDFYDNYLEEWALADE
ncbi:MAG: hypothetical protein HY210_02340 [Candidatus Omnitrophica bacterium]|nr:hypothetical protein [Candidatus Omnitrophota bacterium]